MKKLYHPLLERIARSAENDLAGIIQHLKEENRILRDKLPKRASLTDQERQRLVKTGRPKTTAEIRELVIKTAKETGWGSTRIFGELKMLGYGRISLATVKIILFENNLKASASVVHPVNITRA